MDEFKTALETESDMLEMAKTDKEDMVFLSYTSGTTEIKRCCSYMRGHTLIYVRALQIGSELKNDVVWATASPGWQKWIWSPFLATLGSGQQDLYTTVSLNQNVFKFIRR